MAKKAKEPLISMPVVNQHAAGIDVGGTFHMVCPRQGEVQKFGVVTQELHHLAQYLQDQGIKHVAMESTGYHWKPLFLLLQDYGFETILVNARHIKNVKGRKTDVVDSQWIQLLHSLGLLSASFQLDNLTEELRHYTRQRRYLVEQRSKFVNKMHAALVQMNIQLGTVLSDLTGKSGQAIIQAIIAGERDGKVLALLADRRVKASQKDIELSLEGNWREELIFELQQCYELYHVYGQQIAKCDERIEQLLQTEVVNQGKEQSAYPGPKKKLQKNDPGFDIATLFYQLSGVDFAAIGGVSNNTLLSLFSEVGWTLDKFPSEKHFCSWLNLAPQPKVSGGKVLSTKIPKKQNRAADALRLAANAIGNSPSHPLHGYFKQHQSRKGRGHAITATAHKLGIIFYHMVTRKEAFNYMSPKEYQEKMRQQSLRTARKMIGKHQFSLEELGFAIAS
jgi:transposase